MKLKVNQFYKSGALVLGQFKGLDKESGTYLFLSPDKFIYKIGYWKIDSGTLVLTNYKTDIFEDQLKDLISD